LQRLEEAKLAEEDAEEIGLLILDRKRKIAEARQQQSKKYPRPE